MANVRTKHSLYQKEEKFVSEWRERFWSNWYWHFCKSYHRL